MTMGVRKVVVGVDGSPASLRALWVAVEEARSRYAPLHILHAVETITVAPPTAVGARVLETDDEVGKRVIEDALAELYGGTPADVSLCMIVCRVPIGQALVNAVSADDLLVVGRSRRGIIRRLIAGSVSQYCVARASCPVLIVPPPEPPRRAYAPHRSRWRVSRR